MKFLLIIQKWVQHVHALILQINQQMKQIYLQIIYVRK